jgi:IMP dehydrogenase/GMP reductase
MNEKENNSRTHEPSLRELTSELDGLRELVDEKFRRLKDIIDERDRLYKERADGQKTAVDAALTANKDLTAQAMTASKESAQKTEQAQLTYNISHNDLLKKQDAMIPRTEFDQAKSTWLEKFDGTKTTWQTQFDSLKDTLKAEIGSLKESRSERGGKELALQRVQTQTNWSTGIVITVCLSVLSLAIALAALLTRVYMGKP